jgi:hypothetical protein
VFLPLPSVSVLCIILSCTKKIVELIRLINFRKNGIPVEGQVYNRRRESHRDRGHKGRTSVPLQPVPSMSHSKKRAL